MERDDGRQVCQIGGVGGLQVGTGIHAAVVVLTCVHEDTRQTGPSKISGRGSAVGGRKGGIGGTRSRVAETRILQPAFPRA